MSSLKFIFQITSWCSRYGLVNSLSEACMESFKSNKVLATVKGYRPWFP